MRTLPPPDLTRTLVATPLHETPGAILLDQTGVRPVPLAALDGFPNAIDTAFAVPSPYRPGVQLAGAMDSGAELAGTPPTVHTSAAPHTFAGPCVIVAHDPRLGTVALTLDEILWVLARVYVLSTYATPDAHVVWTVEWGD